MKTIKRGTIWLLTTLILLSSVGMIGYSSNRQGVVPAESSNNPINIMNAPQISELKVHFIDVSQGDSILIQSGNQQRRRFLLQKHRRVDLLMC